MSQEQDDIQNIFGMIGSDRKLGAEWNTEVRVELSKLEMKIDNLQKSYDGETTVDKQVLAEIQSLKSAKETPAKGNPADLLKDWKIILAFLAVVLGGPEGIDVVKSQFFPVASSVPAKSEYVPPVHKHHGTSHTHSGDRVPKLEGF